MDQPAHVRLTKELVTLGHPVVGASGTSAADVRLSFAPGTTTVQAQAAQTYATITFNWGAGTHTAWLTAERKNAAKTGYDGTDDRGRSLRALGGLTLDEVNILRLVTVGVTTATWNPASIANGAELTSPNLTVNGAAFGDMVQVAAPYDLQGIMAFGYVSAANTVRVRLRNGTGAAIDLASGDWKAWVSRPVPTPPRMDDQARTAFRNRVDGES